MTPLHALILMPTLQIAGYLLLDRYRLSGWKYLLLALLLIADFILLPHYYASAIEHVQGNRARCALPAMAVIFGFWILGGGSIITTHFIYAAFCNLKNKKENSGRQPV
jgi:hypothetical protein